MEYGDQCKTFQILTFHALMTKLDEKKIYLSCVCEKQFDLSEYRCKKKHISKQLIIF